MPSGRVSIRCSQMVPCFMSNNSSSKSTRLKLSAVPRLVKNLSTCTTLWWHWRRLAFVAIMSITIRAECITLSGLEKVGRAATNWTISILIFSYLGSYGHRLVFLQKIESSATWKSLPNSFRAVVLQRMHFGSFLDAGFLLIFCFLDTCIDNPQ